MALFRKNNLFSSSPSLLSRLQALVFERKKWTHASTGEGGGAQAQDARSSFSLREGSFDTSTWKTVDSRTFGIDNTAISQSTWTVLKILRWQGFDAYLVGGCVRDLILGKKPKDFDVVTTATLEQIKRQFHRSMVVGRRFPICMVYVSGSKTEVSSFETIHIDAQQRQAILFSQMPNDCSKGDFVRWKDCMRRDFTINGLFYDPFVNTIYDYADGVKDVMASKVRTLIPAHLSFAEDCGRILRGIRIVARLGLRFSKETSAAVQDLCWSITSIDKPRLMLEMNFMLSYGAAVPSISLLQKYKLLEVLLPIQAAYLADQSKKRSGGHSIMLMKLFSHLDKVLAVDRPSGYILWVALLAFHLALVNHPQNDLVIWTLSSILYLGTWDRGIEFVRERVRQHVQFVPEIIEFSETGSDELFLEETEADDSLLEKTSQLASLVISSIGVFTNEKDLKRYLEKYEMTLPSSDLEPLVFVSENTGKGVAKLFGVLEHDIKSYVKKRETFDVNYELLKRGDPNETRFVLGKVIFDTLNSELAFQDNQNQNEVVNEIEKSELSPQNNQNQIPTIMKMRQLPVPACDENENEGMDETKNEVIGKQKQKAAKAKKRRSEKSVAKLFEVLDYDIKSNINVKETFDVNHGLLKRGDPNETIPVSGKVIFDRLTSELASQEYQNQNQNEIVADIKKSELSRQNNQNQKSTTMKTRQLPLPARDENEAMDGTKNELIHNQKQKATTAKKRSLLSSLFK